MNTPRSASSVPVREILPHLAALAFVLVCIQLPRIGGLPARLAAPVFPATRGFLDFDLGYYPAGQAIRSNPEELYRGAVFNESTGKLDITAPANFVNIPLVAWLFAPFTLLPLPRAGLVLLILNTLLTLASLALLLRVRNVRSKGLRWAITLAFAISGPLFNALNMGQTSPLVLFLLILMESSLRRDRDVPAGIWMGLIGLIKIPPLLLLPYFALRKQWRVLAAAVSVLAGVTLVSILCYGWSLHAEYFNLVFRANFGNAIAAHNCQSISSFLARAFTGASLISWEPIQLPGSIRVLQGLLQLAVLIFAVRTVLRAPRNPAADIGMVAAAGLLVSPVSWAHYGIWLIPAIAYLAEIRMTETSAVQRWWLPGLALLLISLPVLPVPIVRQLESALWFRIAVSHLFFGTLLVFALLTRRLSPTDRRLPAGTTDRRHSL